MDLAGSETINMRLFEATGSGVFLLTEYHDNLREYFEPGKEVETFGDRRELVEKDPLLPFPSRAARSHSPCRSGTLSSRA